METSKVTKWIVETSIAITAIRTGILALVILFSTGNSNVLWLVRMINGFFGSDTVYNLVNVWVIRLGVVTMVVNFINILLAAFYGRKEEKQLESRGNMKSARGTHKGKTLLMIYNIVALPACLVSQTAAVMIYGITTYSMNIA